MINIAVIMVGYKCHENLTEIMAPWNDAKLIKPIEGIKFHTVATTALFKEYADLGAEYDNKETEEALIDFNNAGVIDYISIIKSPILDYESRVAGWNLLKNLDIDFIWQVDLLDEYYSYDQIKATCEWLKNNDLYDFYRINFKNYFGRLEDKTYVMDFKPVRILNNRRNGGVDNFYFDNDVTFKNGAQTPRCAGITIPNRVCNPRHLSWVGDEEFLSKKIQYQHKAIKCCSYKWDEAENRLSFDEGYYKMIGQPKPMVYKDL